MNLRGFGTVIDGFLGEFGKVFGYRGAEEVKWW